MRPSASTNNTGVAAAIPQIAQTRAAAMTRTANAMRKRDTNVTGAIEPAYSRGSVGGTRSTPDRIWRVARPGVRRVTAGRLAAGRVAHSVAAGWGARDSPEF